MEHERLTIKFNMRSMLLLLASSALVVNALVACAPNPDLSVKPISSEQNCYKVIGGDHIPAELYQQACDVLKESEIAKQCGLPEKPMQVDFISNTDFAERLGRFNDPGIYGFTQDSSINLRQVDARVYNLDGTYEDRLLPPHKALPFLNHEATHRIQEDCDQLSDRIKPTTNSNINTGFGHTIEPIYLGEYDPNNTVGSVCVEKDDKTVSCVLPGAVNEIQATLVENLTARGIPSISVDYQQNVVPFHAYKLEQIVSAINDQLPGISISEIESLWTRSLNQDGDFWNNLSYIISAEYQTEFDVGPLIEVLIENADLGRKDLGPESLVTISPYLGEVFIADPKQVSSTHQFTAPENHAFRISNLDGYSWLVIECPDGENIYTIDPETLESHPLSKDITISTLAEVCNLYK